MKRCRGAPDDEKAKMSTPRCFRIFNRVDRSAVIPPETLLDLTTSHLLQRILPQQRGRGYLLDVQTIDQTHCAWRPLLQQFAAPQGFCGAAACASAVLLHEVLEEVGSVVCSTEELLLEAAENVLGNISTFKGELEKTLAFFRTSRERYMTAHAEEFRGMQVGYRQKYLSAWYANYELSDYLRTFRNLTVFFLRFNQWPIRGKARHEELRRILEEEQRFGGCVVGTGRVTYGPMDSSLLVDVVLPAGERMLLAPCEFLGSAYHKHPSAKVVVLDLQGHYAVCVCFQNADRVPITVVFDTMAGRTSIQREMIVIAHDMFAVR